MHKNQTKPKHLSIWQDHMSFEEFVDCCGNWRQDWKSLIRQQIKNKQYKKVLDAAAGVCSMYFGFQEDDYEIDYTACDITKKYVDFARFKGIKCNLESIESMSFEDSEFDCVMCLDTINHLVDYRPAIRELIRVSKNEVIISLFKEFQEYAKLMVDYHGSYETFNSPLGLIEKRVKVQNETVCVYNFINKEKLESFLDLQKDIAHWTIERNPHSGPKYFLRIEKN